MNNSIAYKQNHSADQWVHRNELRQGMYIVELDRPWDQTPFMFQGFELQDAVMVEHVQQFCEYALVQSRKTSHSVRTQSVSSRVSRVAASQSIWKRNAR